jgi:hypothetical protein
MRLVFVVVLYRNDAVVSTTYRPTETLAERQVTAWRNRGAEFTGEWHQEKRAA